VLHHPELLFSDIERNQRSSELIEDYGVSSPYTAWGADEEKARVLPCQSHNTYPACRGWVGLAHDMVMTRWFQFPRLLRPLTVISSVLAFSVAEYGLLSIKMA